MKKRLELENLTKEQKTLQSIYFDAARRISSSPTGVCPIDMTLSILRMYHTQSCGKCVPCRVGLGQLVKLIEKILDGEAEITTIDLIKRTAQVIFDTADCAIGYEAARAVLMSIDGFYDDYVMHINEGKCLEGTRQAIPCTAVCPAHVDVPGYISLVLHSKYDEAVDLIRKDNPFPSVCGYVCEHPCERNCRRHMVDDAVNILGIKRYAVDHATLNKKPEINDNTNKKIAVIGGGPGGLTCAYFLSLMGHKVVVYEKMPKLGGMLRYGIPSYRLPREVLDKDIEYVLSTGIEVKYNINVGKDITIDELKKQYDAVYLSIGAHNDKKLGIEGEDANNVISAVKFLREIGEGNKIDLKNKTVCVVGGGNVAMDAVRTSLRLGAKSVKCVYRRRVVDMTALPEEIHEAEQEGAIILTLQAPDHIEKDNNGNAVALYTKPQIISIINSDGRTEVRNSNKDLYKIDCDYIIVAIGQAIDLESFKTVKSTRSTFTTENTSFVPDSGNVFAGGDAVSGPATVIKAVAAGKVAADNIDEFLGFNHKIKSDIDIPNPNLTNMPRCGRVNLTNKLIDNIEGDFSLVSEGMSEEEVKQECSRCLRCDHFGYGSFREGRNIEW